MKGSLRFNFEALKKLLYIFLICFASTAVFAGNADKEKKNTKVITGRVTSLSGEAVAGAKIVIAETGETFFADMDGYYKLEVKTDKAYSITVNTIGYQPAEYKSNSLGTFTDLSLQEL